MIEMLRNQKTLKWMVRIQLRNDNKLWEKYVIMAEGTRERNFKV